MPEKLKLVSYNIQNGVHQDAVTRNFRKMADEGVDIFCLQEARTTEQDFIGDRLQTQLGNDWQGEHFLGTDNPRIDLGLSLFWKSAKLQLKELEKVNLPKVEKLGFFERQATSTPKPPQRGAIVATFDINNIPLRITNLHLDWQGGASQRRAQLRFLAAHLKLKPDVAYEIICGDFNTLGRPASAKKQQNEMQRILGEEFTEVFPNLKWTSDGASIDPQKGLSNVQGLLVNLGIRFHQRLDYVFLRGVIVVDANMERVDGSDHYPLVVTFGIEH